MNELEMRVEVLSEHVARLEGVIDVMLQEAETGTLEQSAPSISARMLRSETELSTHTAPILRVTSKSTIALMRFSPASLSVEIPCMPSTSKP